VAFCLIEALFAWFKFSRRPSSLYSRRDFARRPSQGWRTFPRNHASRDSDDLASRLANRVQLTSDGHRAYLEAVEGAFGGDIDYAMLVKLYGESPEAEKRYSPAVCIGAHKTVRAILVRIISAHRFQSGLISMCGCIRAGSLV
jgi:hypothetical protein